MSATKRTLAIGAAIALPVSLAACGSGGGSESVTIQFASYAPQAHILNQTIEKWLGDVEEETDGRVTFEATYGGGLLAADDTLEGVRDRRADGGLVGAVYYEGELPLSSITGVPYMVDHYPAAMATLQDLSVSNADFKAEYEKYGSVPVFFLPASDSLLGAKEAPIESIADLEGVAIRSVGSTTQTMEAVGANPVAIEFNEIYESLERGVIDAYAGVLLDSVTASGFHEVAPFVSNPGQGLLSTYSIIVNEDVWADISTEDQELILELGREASEWYFANEGEALEESCEIIRESGGTVTQWSDDSIDEWKQAIGAGPLDAWHERAGDAGAEFEAAYTGGIESKIAEMPAYESPVEACASTFQ